MPSQPAAGAPSRPLVSMVMPSFNHARYLPEAIDSLLSQDYQPLEVIVVDGGSSDETLDVLRQYAGRLTWVSEPDQGMYDAVNKGWRMAHGAYLGFLNADDRLCPGALTLLVEHLSTHPAVGLAYGDYHRMDEHGAVLERFRAAPQTTENLLRHGNTIFTGASLFRAEVLQTAGWLDTSLKSAADYDFVIRVSRHYPLGYLPVPLAQFRIHAGSMSQYAKQAMWREALSISTRHGGQRAWSLYSRYWFDTLINRLFPRRLLWGSTLVPMRKLLRRLWGLGH